MRIALVVSSLQCGGAERIAVQMVDYWAAQGHEVSLIYFHEPGQKLFFAPRVEVRRMEITIAPPSGTIGRVLRFFTRVRKIRQALVSSKAEVVISHGDLMNIFSLFASRKLALPAIVTEHSMPQVYPQSRFLRMLRSSIYGSARAIVVLNETAAEFFRNSFGTSVHVIENPVLPPPGEIVRDPQRQIIALGRLSFEKGLDMLIRAFGLIAAVVPGVSLVIWGEGPERNSLERLVKELSLQDRVRLPGITAEPHREIARSLFVVLSSRSEAFPTVIGEALSCGVPVISFDCPSGPRAMIRDGIDGLLVPPDDTGALALAMKRLLDDAELRQRLSSRAVEISERLSQTKQMKRWEELLK